MGQDPNAVKLVDYVLGASPFALVVMAGVANYFGIWYWGKDRRDLLERHRVEVAELKADRDEYKALCYQLSGVAALAAEATRMALPPRAGR
jgi:hypothetical protein